VRTSSLLVTLRRKLASRDEEPGGESQIGNSGFQGPEVCSLNSMLSTPDRFRV